jgi:hypothetical protein
VKFHIYAQVEALAIIVSITINPRIIYYLVGCIYKPVEIHLVIVLYDLVITPWIKSEGNSSSTLLSFIQTC